MADRVRGVNLLSEMLTGIFPRWNGRPTAPPADSVLFPRGMPDHDES